VAPPILALRGVSAGFGDPALFEGLDVHVGPRDRIALVGRNGSGKSTLLKIFAGIQQSDGGERFMQPGTRVAYLGQEVDLSGHKAVVDYVASRIAGGDESSRYLVDTILSEVQIPGAASPSSLSGGERRRVALAGVLVQDPDVLFLDEPTNHLDLDAIEWLEDRLNQFSGALVMVSHDRAFLRRLSRVTLWLDRGKIHRLEKGYQHFDEWSERILEQQAEDTAKLDKLIAEETRWSREGISARRTRNQGRLRRLYALRDERQSHTSVENMVALEADSSRTSGRLVAEVSDISKSFGDICLISGFSTRIMRGDRVGIIGPNGAGKTTLLRILTGDLLPDSGSVRLGTNLDILTFDQNRSDLDPEATLWESLCESGGDQIDVRGKSKHIVGYLKEFLFHPGQARSPVKSLSGGEKNRLLLAKHLAKPSNVMILDEPTNDLDLETLDLLQEMLADYDGTVLLVSHDRDFLDRVVSSTIVLEGHGKLQEYPGGYSDYLRQRKAIARDGDVFSEEKSSSSRSGKPTKKSQRMSYKDKRLLEELPTRIDLLQADIKRLHVELGRAGQDGIRIRELSEALAVAMQELATAEENWLRLELLREELQI